MIWTINYWCRSMKEIDQQWICSPQLFYFSLNIYKASSVHSVVIHVLFPISFVKFLMGQHRSLRESLDKVTVKMDWYSNLFQRMVGEPGARHTLESATVLLVMFLQINIVFVMISEKISDFSFRSLYLNK